MASGKQLSFQHGEISPAEKYQSDDVAYSTALEKLRNMDVRRTGGINNRPGTEYDLNVMQEFDDVLQQGDGGILAEGEPTPIRTFYVSSDTHGDLEITVVRNQDQNIRGGDTLYDTSLFVFDVYINNRYAGYLLHRDENFLERLDVTTFKGWYIFTPAGGGGEGAAAREDSVLMGINESMIQNWKDNSYASSDTPLVDMDGLTVFGDGYPTVSGWAASMSYDSTAEYVSVTYMMTAESANGVEVEVFRFQTANVDADGKPTAATELCYPIFGRVNSLTIDLNSGVDRNVTRLNLYRALGVRLSGSGDLDFSLAARFRPAPGDTAAYFRDAGEGDPSYGPPIDKSLVSYSGAQDIPKGFEHFAVYQERLFGGVKPISKDTWYSQDNPPELKLGQVLASKLGAIQFSKPYIVRNTEAFSFSTPVRDSSAVVSMLSDQRLVALTEEGVYIVAGGGQQGIVTPTEINPIRVFGEGCSPTIKAKMSGKVGVFINKTHTKLMGIFFTSSGISVRELSKLSTHFVDGDICAMETLIDAQGESKVYLLGRSGTLVSITVNEDGVAGFSAYEFEEGARPISIYRARRERDYHERYSMIGSKYDCLGIYMVRNNYLTREIIGDRPNSDTMLPKFADMAMPFGSRLSLLGQEGYLKIDIGILNWWYAGNSPVYVNLTAASWNPGDPITMSVSKQMADRSVDHIQIQHFYENSEGKLRSIFLKPDWDSESESVLGIESTGQIQFDWVGSLIAGYGRTVTFIVDNVRVPTVYPQAGDFILDAQDDLTIYIRSSTKPEHLLTSFAANASSAIKALYNLSLTAGTPSDAASQSTFVDGDVTTLEGTGYEVTVYCDYEIPEELRDIDSMTITQAEKNKRKSRWLIATKKWGGAFDPLYYDHEQIFRAGNRLCIFNYDTGSEVYEDGTVELSVVADNQVVSSPLNDRMGDAVTLSLGEDGMAMSDLPNPASFGYIGLPYTAYMETLPIEPADNRTLTDSNKVVNEVGAALYKTQRGLVGDVGTDVERLNALVERNETDLMLGDTLFSGHVDRPIESRWSKEGRITIKQVDPAPISIMSVYPKGLAGD